MSFVPARRMVTSSPSPNPNSAGPDFHSLSLKSSARHAAPSSLPLSRYFQSAPRGTSTAGNSPPALTLMRTGVDQPTAPRLSVALAVMEYSPGGGFDHCRIHVPSGVRNGPSALPRE